MPTEPLVIAHRGASGYRPEHTLAAYELGARQGADLLEPDLVLTADGVLVCRHEPEIATSTDVADHPEFADRKATRRLDGIEIEGWFTEDFTLAELKTLRARERIPDLRPANAEHDGAFDVPTFQEVVDLAARLTDELGRQIGVYPELKHPTYFRERGLALEPALVGLLRENGLEGRDAPVWVQSFELWNLREVREEVDTRLVYLIGAATRHPYDLQVAGDDRTYGDLTSAEDLRRFAADVDAVGPNKEHIVPRDGDGRSLAPTSFLDDAHAAGLEVHPYTFRSENAFLPAELRTSDDPTADGDWATELRQFVDLGADALFTDQPDKARAVLDGLAPRRRRVE